MTKSKTQKEKTLNRDESLTMTQASHVARWSVDLADALIAELDKKEGGT